MEKEVDGDNFYDELCMDDLLDNDEISSTELGFMMGWIEDFNRESEI